MKSPSVGYLGVDVLNNATVCNEALGLLEAGTPLDIVTVHRFDQATYYQSDSLAKLIPRIHALYPLGWWGMISTVLAAPVLFGTKFWSALFQMLICPAEGWRQKARLAWHFVPALCLARYWQKRNIGHIHAHWAHTATTMAMHAAKLLGVGFSFTGHANDLFVHRVALAAKLRRARFTVCISEFHQQFYRKLGADRARLPIVYCGIDTNRFHKADASMTDTRLDPPQPRILAVGRLVEKKGFHDLIEACAVLKNRGVEFECVIAGSGPEQHRLRWMIECLGLRDRVKVTGRTVLQEDLEGLLRSATVFALPCVKDSDGDMDGLPQVLIEAMVCGVPCVSTELVGIPDLVRDGWNGLLVPPHDIAGLADAIARLLDDPDDAALLGERGHDWARRHFSRKQTIHRLSRLFTAAIASKSSVQLVHGWHEAPKVKNCVLDDSFAEILAESPATAEQLELCGGPA